MFLDSEWMNCFTSKSLRETPSQNQESAHENCSNYSDAFDKLALSEDTRTLQVSRAAVTRTDFRPTDQKRFDLCH